MPAAIFIPDFDDVSVLTVALRRLTIACAKNLIHHMTWVLVACDVIGNRTNIVGHRGGREAHDGHGYQRCSSVAHRSTSADVATLAVQLLGGTHARWPG